MSYYRDKRNPEAVHFPAQMHVAATYLLVLIALLAVLELTLIYSRGTRMWADLAALGACAAVVVFSYPKRVTTDETGVHTDRFPGFHRRLIRWGDVESVREQALVPGLPAFLRSPVANWAIVVRSANGAQPVRFTCRQSGREVFLLELKRWSAPGPVLKNPPGRCI